jgi:WD40 repeat protein
VQFIHQGEDIRTTTVSRDGRRVASGGVTGTLAIWDSATGERRPLEPLGAPPTALAFDGTGDVLAAATAERVRVYDLARGTRRELVPDAGRPVSALALDDRGTWVAVLHFGGRLSLRDIDSGQELRAAETMPEAAGVVVSDDQLTLLLTGTIGSVLRLALPDLRPLHRPTGMLTPASGATHAFSADGTFFGMVVNRLITVDKPADLSYQKEFPMVSFRQADVLAVSPSGERVAVARGGQIVIVDALESDLRPPVVPELTGHSRIGALHFLADDRLVSVEGDKLAFWNLADPSGIGTDLSAEIPDETTVDVPAEAAVRRDGQQLAWAEEDGTLVLRDLSGPGAPLAIGNVGWVPTYSPDGSLLAAAGRTGGQFWDLRSEPPNASVRGGTIRRSWGWASCPQEPRWRPWISRAGSPSARCPPVMSSGASTRETPPWSCVLAPSPSAAAATMRRRPGASGAFR